MDKSELNKSETAAAAAAASAVGDVAEFSNLITKFLYLNCDDKSNKNNNNVEELNSILNELNCLALEHGKWHALDKSVLNLLGSLKNIPISNDTLIVKACCLICSIINNSSSTSLSTIPPAAIPLVIIRETIDWLLKCLTYNFDSIICNVLAALQCLIKGNVAHLHEFYDYLMATDGLFVRVIKDFQPMNTPTRYDSNRPEEIQLYVILCIETFLHGLCQQQQQQQEAIDDSIDGGDNKDLMVKFPLEYLTAIGNCLLKTIYCKQMNNLEEHSFCTFITTGLNTCKYIAILDDKWSRENIGELLGAAEAYITYGLSVDSGNNTTVIQPQKVHISQQAIIEPQYVNLNKGGKVSKTRKLKDLTKPTAAGGNKSKKKKGNKKSTSSTSMATANHHNQNNNNNNNNDYYNRDHSSYFDRNLQFDSDTNNFLSSTFLTSTTTKTSDSDFSDAADSNRAQKDRQKKSKVRLAAISVIGILAKNIEKKLFVGYWHSIFPQDNQQIKYSILNTIIGDPNIKCRSAALQTMAISLYGSRPFLIQAEYSEKSSASFIPFSITLGNMTVTIYRKLTEALADETSTQVLINVLKCFAVLLQVTALHKLQNGIVTKFIVYIKRLAANHSDINVQIAAIKVIGFLLSTQEITPEISQCIGIPTSINYNSSKKTPNDLHNFGINEIIDSEYGDDDDGCDGDPVEIDPYDTDLENVNVPNVNTQVNVNQPAANKVESWLLLLVLDKIKDSKLPKSRNPNNLLKIECFQLLSAMGQHFILLKDHLPAIAIELIRGINENELQLCTVKCLDIIGYSINQYLLLNDQPARQTAEYINVCLTYWLTILPVIIKQLQDLNGPQKTNLKIICLDALSNIGVHVYERLPRDKQMLLISILSGCAFDDEHMICASAVRALAIYAKYPTLCDDNCFIENTIEAICRLMKEQFLVARIKASWALASITDVFLTNSSITKSSSLSSQSSSSQSSTNVISNDLLRRLFEISIEMTSDNDKVRCNAVRIIGNLLRLITIEQITLPIWMDLCYRSIACLVHNSIVVNNMKVKWNSCYAIGNFMRNNVMFQNSNNCNWQKITFPALCNTIVNCPIFKVRINAVCALAIPSERQYYNKYFIEIWKSLLMAIEKADQLNNVNEYKHRDNLIEQLCITISHLINVCELNDLCEMENELQQQYDVVKLIWERVINRIVSEKVHSLMAACKKLNDIQQQTAMTVNQKLSITMLRSCFIEINEYNL